MRGIRLLREEKRETETHLHLDNHEKHNVNQETPPITGGIALPTEAERREQERERRDNEYRSDDAAFKARQLKISGDQAVTNQRIALYTLLLAFLSLVGNGIAIYSATASRASADAATKAAKAAESAADTAASNLDAYRKAFQIDQRPYLVATTPVFVEPPLAGSPIRVNMTIKNIGKTPAIKILTHLTLSPLRPSKIDRSVYVSFINSTFAELRKKDTIGREELKHGTAEHDIAPGGDFFSTNQNSVVLSATDFPLTQTGAITLMYTGIVSYGDAFGGAYVTEFCYQFFGTDAKTWHICDSNNSIK